MGATGMTTNEACCNSTSRTSKSFELGFGIFLAILFGTLVGYKLHVIRPYNK
jgi:hypothetical protein